MMNNRKEKQMYLMVEGMRTGEKIKDNSYTIKIRRTRKDRYKINEICLLELLPIFLRPTV